MSKRNMSDSNEARLSGTIDHLKKVNTKSGNPMAEVILKVRKDSFRVTAFGNVAEYLLLTAHPGCRLFVTGTLTTSSWKDEATEEWCNSFAVTAWGIEMHGEKISYQRAARPEPPSPHSFKQEFPGN